MNRPKFVAAGVATFAASASFLSLSSAGTSSQESVSGLRRMLTLHAKPTSITLDSASTAIIVVDKQNDFGAKGGMFDRAGIDISIMQRVVALTARVLADGRKAAIKVIDLKMAYRPDRSDVGTPGSPNWGGYPASDERGDDGACPQRRGEPDLGAGTWHSDSVNGLKPESADTANWKSRFSGFYETERGIKSPTALLPRYLIVTGYTRRVGVESTINDAMFRGLLASAAGGL